MYGFYLQTDSEKFFISDQYLRYKLLNNSIPPVSLYSKENNSEEKFFNKISVNIKTIKIDTLLKTFEKMLNKNNIDNISALLSLNREHTLAILYLLQIGNLKENEILEILNSSSYYTRNELLLKKLSDSTDFDIFAKLKTAFTEKSNVKNINEACTLDKNKDNIFSNFELGPIRNVFYNGNLYYTKSKSPLFDYTDSLKFEYLSNPNNISGSSYVYNLLSERHTPEEINRILSSSSYGALQLILNNIRSLYRKDTYYLDGTMILADVYATLAYFWANYDFKNRYSEDEVEIYNKKKDYNLELRMRLKESFRDSFNYILYSDLRNDCEKDRANDSTSGIFNVYFWLSMISNNKEITDVETDNPYKRGTRKVIHSMEDIKEYAYNDKASISSDETRCILSSGKFLNGYGAFPLHGKEEKDLRGSILAFEGIDLTKTNTLLYLTQSDIDYMKSFFKDFCTSDLQTQMSNDILISHFIKIFVYYNKHSDVKEVNSQSFYLKSIDKYFAEKIIEKDFLINDKKLLLNFGTCDALNILTEIEKYIHENNDYNDTVESLMNTSDSRETILENIRDTIHSYDIKKSSDPILTAYVKYILINYIEYLLDNSLENNEENFQKIFLINDDFLLAYYGLLFYIRHLYLHMADVISDVNADELGESILTGNIFNRDGFDSIREYALKYSGNPSSIIERLDDLYERIEQR